MEKFTEVLVDPVNWFAFRVDRVALKKSSNNEVYEHRKNFYEELTKKDCIEINEKNNFKDKEKVKGYKKLDTSIARLCIKFNSLKPGWRNLYSHIKRGSSLASSSEPFWFGDMDPFLVRIMPKSDLVPQHMKLHSYFILHLK